MTKVSKEALVHANDDALVSKCQACIRIVDQQTRAAAVTAQADSAEAGADPDVPVLRRHSAESNPETLGLVFSFFYSVPEVVDLDSIYKRQLLREVRIMRFAQGSTVRFCHTSKPHSQASNVILRARSLP